MPEKLVPPPTRRGKSSSYFGPNQARMAHRLEAGIPMRLSDVPSARFAPILVLALCAGSTTGLAQSSPPPATSSPAASTPAAKPPATNTAHPQSAAPSSQPAVFKSTAALVLVDVLVSNGQEAIHGIPRDQFRLLEDGKEQKLIAVEEHRAVDPATIQKPP